MSEVTQRIVLEKRLELRGGSATIKREGEFVTISYGYAGRLTLDDQHFFAKDIRALAAFVNETEPPMTTNPDELVEDLREFRRFLNGSGPLDGVHFGEWNGRYGPYWWRQHLDRIDTAADLITSLQDRIAQLEEALQSAVDDATGKPNVWFFKAKDALRAAQESKS
jgi:hypothetical protein